MTTLLTVLSGVTGLFCVLLAGTFFAFSTVVMPGLRRLPDEPGIRAMQAMNVQAPRSLLMVPLLGAAAGGIAVVVVALAAGTGGARAWCVAGGLCAVAGLVITGVYHVPRNNALDRMDAASAEATAYWRRYLPGWTRWNHLRALVGTAGSVALPVAMIIG